MHGLGSMQASADRISATIQQQPAEHAVVVMAHNGPAGLGDQQHDICGKDWSDKAGKQLLTPPVPTRLVHSFITHVCFP